uniref:HD domain-containing protein n=1 Tax=Fervidobacterium nodosum TaxID=2424 RepID=A0A7C5U358_9BACT
MNLTWCSSFFQVSFLTYFVQGAPEEYIMMKNHTIEGAKLFSNLVKDYPSNSLLKMCLEVTRWHHERCDGKGYPDGLKGDRIPLAARIVAIADVFDALTTRRAYRNECTPEEAIDIMITEEEGYFDPKLLEIFVEHKQLFSLLSRSRLAVQLEELKNQ